ncbi:hypothetical protein BgiMline_032537 [Biomphalaria glabrata]
MIIYVRYTYTLCLAPKVNKQIIYTVATQDKLHKTSYTRHVTQDKLHKTSYTGQATQDKLHQFLSPDNNILPLCTPKRVGFKRSVDNSCDHQFLQCPGYCQENTNIALTIHAFDIIWPGVSQTTSTF